MILEQDSIDLLFTKPNRAKSSTITCRVCNVRETVPLDWPALLCTGCSEDIEKIETHIQEVLDSYTTQVENAWSKLDADIAHSDEGLLIRWNNFQDAVTNGDALVDKAEAAARAGAIGPLSDLIRAWLAYKDALDALSNQQYWAAKAKEELAVYKEQRV